jgi:DNA repair protein RecO
METFHTEGIVLQTINFRDYDLIASVFTPDSGLIKLMVNFGNHPKKGMKIAPMSRIELSYSRGKGDLLKCVEVKVIDQFPLLREKFEFLQSAGQILLSLLHSHFPEKPAPMLYQILLNYLEKLPSAEDPCSLPASFSLKLMRS